MKLVVLPRSPNPYQRLLYDEVKRAGHSVRYAGRRTRSHTLNMLLLPLELSLCRAAGWRTLHIHWVYEFGLPGADGLPFLRRVAEAWFSVVLAVARVIGMRIVWTAHNVLPHERVFHDEIAARRRLSKASDMVLVHSPGALDGLRRIGAAPKRFAFVPLGPLSPDVDASTLRRPGTGEQPLSLLFFGQVREHKGVEDLLEAMALVPRSVEVRLLVAGDCPDRELADRLATLARRCGERVSLRLEHIPDEEVTVLLAASDLVVLPFRRVTTSSSALLAMGHGRGLVLPDVPAFADLPREAAVFYDGSVQALRQVIIDAAQWSPARLQELGTAGSTYAGTLSWADTASQTLAAIGRDEG
jgi:glycosyltransferase involved in cell wall biosynthesis